MSSAAVVIGALTVSICGIICIEFSGLAPCCYCADRRDTAFYGILVLFQLLHILNEQKRWEKEDKLATFNASCAIFVCNWWDQVIAQNEEDKVWKYTLETLGKFDVKQEQIFKMSTTEV